MFPFYQRIVALVFAGVAAIVAYSIWFSTKKKTEETALEEIKADLKAKEEAKKTEKEEESTIKETSQKEPEKPKEVKHDDVREPEVAIKQGDLKTCKSIRGAGSPPQMSARRTGSTTSVLPANEQKSALTLLNEIKENSKRTKLDVEKTTAENGPSEAPTQPTIREKTTVEPKPVVSVEAPKVSTNTPTPQEPKTTTSESGVAPTCEPSQPPKEAPTTAVAVEASAPEPATCTPGASQTSLGEASASAPVPINASVMETTTLKPQEASPSIPSESTPTANKAPTVPPKHASVAEPVKEGTPKAPTEAASAPEATPKEVETNTATPVIPSLPIPSSTKDTATVLSGGSQRSREIVLPGVPQGSRETAMPVEPPAKPLPPPTPSESVPVQAPLEAPPPKSVDSTPGSVRLAVTPKPASTVDSKVDLSKVMKLHQCFCRPFGKSKPLGDEECRFDEKVKLKLKPTGIHPISYSYHDSKPVIKPIKKSTSLAKEILTRPKKENADYLTVFSPILNAVEYGHQHFLMLQDLIGNKDLFDY